MQVVYQYLIATLLPANIEAELQGGSMPRNSSSPFASLHHGRFITGPANLKGSSKDTTMGKIPRVFLFSSGKPIEYHLVVYRALSASLCMFIKGIIIFYIVWPSNYIGEKLMQI